jgi:integrative and conjugative element protein (TIGR02256 family)
LHHRFAGFPHVNWKSSLCLYQAPATEWDPSDGMFGFLERLHHFLRQGALGQLDPIGGALHPPVAYLGDGPVRIVIPRVDTPRVDGEPWFGTAHLRVHSELRVDIVGWSPYLDRGTPQNVAAVVLLPVPLPYEFPTKAGDLFAAFTERGVSQDQFFRTMQWAVLNNDADSPLFVVLGTPMRGIRGEQLRQHLAAWYIDPLHAWALKTELDRYSEDVEKQACGERLREILLEWAKIAPVEWCCVRENRPEIVTRRDQGSPMGWFAGRTVSIWGCGALGGHVAEHLARAGVRRLLLRDSGVVSPGVLLRQPYDDADVGTAKATALAACLRRICPDLEVETSTRNLIDDPLSAEDWSSGADLVIDAAASAAVMSLLEKRRWANGVVAAPIVSMAISHDATLGMVVTSFPEHSGGPLDISRQLKLAACGQAETARYADGFWPDQPRPIFQPEPGCSDATFVGSSADVAALAAMMLNRAATDLLSRPNGATATGHLVTQPHACGPGGRGIASYSWWPDVISNDIHTGYQIRVSPTAWRDIRSWIDRSAEAKGPRFETGGLLFGERDDAAGVIWVSEVSGPPGDSSASAMKFICGIAGTAELNSEKRKRSRGAIQYVGMWHTHPDSHPLPSATDWDGMRRLVREAGGASRSLLLIVGCPHDRPLLGTYVFRAADFGLAFGTTVIRPCLIRDVSWDA